MAVGTVGKNLSSDPRTVLNGSGAPTSTVGLDNDFYIDVVANRIYGPKTSGAWGSGTSLVGSPGATGDVTPAATTAAGTAATAATAASNSATSAATSLAQTRAVNALVLSAYYI